MRTVAATDLERWTRELLGAAGLEPQSANTVAHSLVDASLRGVDSHGVARVPIYVARLRTGATNPRPRPAVISRHGAIAVVDGDRGPGQVAGVFATDLSIALAREHGTGVALVRHSSHYGAAGYYTMRAARQGLVAMSTTNADPLVVPFGGLEPALGTNPIAFAAPTTDGVFDLDMATSQVAINRIYNARDEGRPIPPDWGVDAQGRPTTDPARVHAAVPLGGYKGYGLALMVEILSAALAGAGITHAAGKLYGADDEPQDIGHFHLAIDPDHTVGRHRFEATISALIAEMRAIPPTGEEVLVPGDPEARTRTEREQDGIPIEPALWRTLTTLGTELGVTPPHGMER
jgi:ureidoglycolate dehydrogenase (NAD+)